MSCFGLLQADPPTNTQKQLITRRSSWRSSISVFDHCCWSHLGGGLPSLSSAFWRQYPGPAYEETAVVVKTGAHQ